MRMPKPLENTDSRWLLPSGVPIARHDLFTLSQPSLQRECRSHGFQFYDATLLLVSSGRLTLDDGRTAISSDAPTSLILIPKNARMDVTKYPGGAGHVFRSVFLTFSRHTVAEFYRHYASTAPNAALVLEPRVIPLDDSLADTLSFGLRGLSDGHASERVQMHRLMGVLIALADRGHQFAQPTSASVADRLHDLLKSDPSQPWTASEAGRALAMSEATLRRRLAEEHSRFEELLADVRMHHAMALLQTTALSIPQVAAACGYRTRARFAERFRKRFGCSPSQAR